jgi:hypothetical protein
MTTKKRVRPRRPRLIDLEVGTFVRVPLADGSFGYGRALMNPYMAFYDYRTAEPSTDLDVIEAQPLVFTTAVRLRDIDGWTLLEARPLQGEVARPVVRFMQDLADHRKCVIFDTAGMERDATPEECVGIERASVWDGHHIQERLLDHFMGRPNAQEIRARVRLVVTPNPFDRLTLKKRSR